MNPQNKVLVVTGAGNGMGREMTLQLLSRGATVAAVDYSEERLNETREKAGAYATKLSLHTADIGRREAVEALPEKILALHGAIDGIINNAGIIQPFVKIEKLLYADIEHVMQVNFYGTLYMVKTFLPYLKQRPEAHIVNLSSMGGFLPVPGQAVYGASKAAVKLFTEALRTELKETLVNVTLVYPGSIATQIAANSGLKMPANTDAASSSFKAMDPALAAKKILDAMESNKARVLVGSDASFMDFLSRLNPVYASDYIYRKMKSLLGLMK